jgi:hypothetical protein
MPMKRFLPNASFSPEEISLMAVAFENACRSLQTSGDTVTREAVAKKIIELAEKGERDPIRMAESALKSMRTQIECADSSLPLLHIQIRRESATE